LERYKKGMPLLVTGDGTQRRDYTHVEDIVDGLILMADNTEICGTYSPIELGRGENYSLNELVRLFDCAEVEYVDRPKGEMAHTLRYDKENEINGLGWNPQRNVKDFIKNMK